VKFSSVSKLRRHLYLSFHSNFDLHSAFNIQHSKLLSASDVNAVLAVRLDPVHRLVGGLNELLGAPGNVGQRGASDGCRERDAETVAFEKPMRRKTVAYALPDRDRTVAGRIGQDEGELVAAKPGDDIGFACARPDDTR